MKTDDLIKALVADNPTVEPPVSRTLMLTMLAGATVAAILFAVMMGPRSDFAWSIVNSPRFIFKFVLTLGLAVPAYFIVQRMARPDATAGRTIWLLALVPLLLAVGVLVEMYVLPADHWPVYMIGTNSKFCVSFIPLFSLAPLAGALLALRRGAPANPTAAGAFAGLLAAGIGATLYGSHCIDDSPLFIAVWYTIAVATVTGLGAFLGSRVLRW
jgi:hypothetical protein